MQIINYFRRSAHTYGLSLMDSTGLLMLSTNIQRFIKRIATYLHTNIALAIDGIPRFELEAAAINPTSASSWSTSSTTSSACSSLPNSARSPSGTRRLPCDYMQCFKMMR